MPQPTTTCAAATSWPGGFEPVSPARWAIALAISGPIMKAAGRRSSRPTAAPTMPQAIRTPQSRHSAVAASLAIASTLVWAPLTSRYQTGMVRTTVRMRSAWASAIERSWPPMAPPSMVMSLRPPGMAAK